MTEYPPLAPMSSADWQQLQQLLERAVRHSETEVARIYEDKSRAEQRHGAALVAQFVATQASVDRVIQLFRRHSESMELAERVDAGEAVAVECPTCHEVHELMPPPAFGDAGVHEVQRALEAGEHLALGQRVGRPVAPFVVPKGDVSATERARRFDALEVDGGHLGRFTTPAGGVG